MKALQRSSRIRNILFWSIISAAFIGPGTVATAAGAGARFGTVLIWALVFSTLATLALQELAARLTIETGMSLGEHLRDRFRRQRWIPVSIWAVVAFGCAAYEAGNILGAVAGAGIAVGAPSWVFTVLIVIFAFILMIRGTVQLIGKVLGCIVAVMGIAFVIVAFGADLGAKALVAGALVPRIPDGSLFLIIALIGTTIVPYNLFLGSGVSKGQSLREMRAGLPIAVAIGGLISIAILIAGTLVVGDLQFETLAEILEQRLGRWGRYLMGIGLLAAGLTSAITAPLAAAITAQGVFPRWKSDTLPFKAVWAIVLLAGFVLSMLRLQPIPVIIAAQALNGILLPVVAIALYEISLKALRSSLSPWQVVATLSIVAVVTFLGCNSLLSALIRSGVLVPDALRPMVAGAIAVVVAAWLGVRTLQRSPYMRNTPTDDLDQS